MKCNKKNVKPKTQNKKISQCPQLILSSGTSGVIELHTLFVILPLTEIYYSNLFLCLFIFLLAFPNKLQGFIIVCTTVVYLVTLL